MAGDGDPKAPPALVSVTFSTTQGFIKAVPEPRCRDGTVGLGGGGGCPRQPPAACHFMSLAGTVGFINA